MNTNNKSNLKKLINLSFKFLALAYILVFLKIVIFKNGLTGGFRSINLRPLLAFTDYRKGHMTGSAFLKNVLGNIGIFIPMGILIAKNSKKPSILRSTFIGLLLSLAIELLQFITGLGMTDIDDCIFNGLGSLIGSVLYLKFLIKLDSRADCPLGSLIFFLIFGIVGSLSLWIFQPNIIPRNPLKVTNLEALEGLDPQSYNFSGQLLDLEDDRAEVRLFIYREGKDMLKEDKSFPINKDKLYLQDKAVEYSSSGMVQNVYLDYKKLEFSELEDLLESGENKIFMWIKDDSLDSLILIVDKKL